MDVKLKLIELAPTHPGWYWYQTTSGMLVCVHVQKTSPGGLQVIDGNGKPRDISEFKGKWSNTVIPYPDSE